MVIDRLFAVPVVNFNVDKVITTDQINFIETLNFKKDNRGIMFSQEKNILMHKELKELKEVLYKNINCFFYNTMDFKEKYKFKVCDSWVVKLVKDVTTPRHIHSFSYFSGVVYLQVTDTDSITFFKPKTLDHSSINLDIQTNQNSWNCFNSHTWSYPVRKGDVLMFPSQLEHMAKTNQSENIRYSLAFNIVPTGLISDTIGASLEYNESTETTVSGYD